MIPWDKVQDFTFHANHRGTEGIRSHRYEVDMKGTIPATNKKFQTKGQKTLMDQIVTSKMKGKNTQKTCPLHI